MGDGFWIGFPLVLLGGLLWALAVDGARRYVREHAPEQRLPPRTRGIRASVDLVRRFRSAAAGQPVPPPPYALMLYGGLGLVAAGLVFFFIVVLGVTA
jgi:hypothetical protein